MDKPLTSGESFRACAKVNGNAMIMREFQSTPAEAHELLDIARRLERLSISRTRPHRFFEERSELVHELKRIARRR